MKIKIDDITWYYPEDWGYIYHYETRTRDQAKFFYDKDLPDWIDLTKEEKEAVKAAIRQLWDDMDEIRNSL